MKKPRNYRKEYDEYQGTKEQKTRRAQRNKARRAALRAGTVSKGDNKELGHIGANRKGRLGDKTKVITRKANRRDQPKRDGSED